MTVARMFIFRKMVFGSAMPSILSIAGTIFRCLSEDCRVWLIAKSIL